jgi:hypothetical protein
VAVKGELKIGWVAKPFTFSPKAVRSKPVFSVQYSNTGDDSKERNIL